MGRARIVDETGEGAYTVELDYGAEEVAERIAALDAEITSLQTQLDAIDVSSSDLASLRAALDAAIWANDTGAIEKATVELLTRSAEVRKAKQSAGYLRLKIAESTTRRGFLAGLATAETRSVWCADLTEEAAGNVQTIEINDEQGEILIAPGAPGPVGDELRHRMAVTAPAALYNAIMLPGVQRHRPRYRTGYITSIDREENTGVVALDDAVSSADGLQINDRSSVDVTFRYMTCNNGAFNVGDEVVVEFGGSWDNATVVGFRSNPKPCGPERLAFPIRVINHEYVQTTPPPQQSIEWNPIWVNTSGFPPNGSPCVRPARIEYIEPEPDTFINNNAVRVRQTSGQLATWPNYERILNAEIVFGDGVLIDGEWTTDYVPEKATVQFSSGASGVRDGYVLGTGFPLSRTWTVNYSVTANSGVDWDLINGGSNPVGFVCTPGYEVERSNLTHSLRLNVLDAVPETTPIVKQWFPAIPETIGVLDKSGNRLQYRFWRMGTAHIDYIRDHPLLPDGNDYLNDISIRDWFAYILVFYELDR